MDTHKDMHADGLMTAALKPLWQRQNLGASEELLQRHQYIHWIPWSLYHEIALSTKTLL
jgi:hypothetical protein